MAHCAALLALVVVLVACDGPKPPKTARVAEAAERTVVSLGTATPGGGFPVYGDAIVPTIAANDPSLDVQAAETTAANTVAAAPRVELLHPGVRRDLREAGLLQ
jgi:TRAP-type uncharacterized transport system substrate-binding protein